MTRAEAEASLGAWMIVREAVDEALELGMHEDQRAIFTNLGAETDGVIQEFAQALRDSE